MTNYLHLQKKTLVALLFLFSVFIAGCSKEVEIEPVRLQGQIFGSFWHATLVGSWSETQIKLLEEGIQQELHKVDISMSTYKEDSELNKFNNAPVNTWVEISAPLYEVFSLSQAVAVTSKGAFDITMGGLVNQWNFGPEASTDAIPSNKDIKDRLAVTGYKYLELKPDSYQARRLKNSYIDLSGVAKGYATDQVAAWLLSQGVANFLINISGETYVAGERKVGQPWRIGVETPDARQRVAQHIIPLTNTSVATSGDYRNFYEIDGRRLSHTINPKTGWPVEHNLTSVTVIHPKNAVADAWATAFMVMGTQASLELANRENLQVLLISREEDGLKSWLSNSMQEALGPEVSAKILH